MKVKLRLRTNTKEKDSMRARYDTPKLEEDDVRKAFTIALKNRYEILEDEGAPYARYKCVCTEQD